MAYHVNFTRLAIKQLEKINNPFYQSIKEAIIRLANDSRPVGYRKLKGRDGFRIRVGDYRVIYEIFDDKLIIEVIAIGNRKNVYD